MMAGGVSLCIRSSLSTRKDRCETIKEMERNKDTSKMTSWQLGAGASLACT